MENIFDLLVDSFVEVAVKRLKRPLFIPLKIELDREVERLFCRERPHRCAEKRRLARLARREEHDVTSLFHAVDKIGELLGTHNDVVSLRHHRPARFKGFRLTIFHSMLFRVVKIITLFILSHCKG